MAAHLRHRDPPFRYRFAVLRRGEGGVRDHGGDIRTHGHRHPTITGGRWCAIDRGRATRSRATTGRRLQARHTASSVLAAERDRYRCVPASVKNAG